MTPSSPSLLFVFFLLLHFLLSAGNPNPRRSRDDDQFSIFRFRRYGTPSPLPPPPDSTPPPPVTCEGGLGGSGSLDDFCEVFSSLVFAGDVFILGAGSLSLSPGVSLACPIPGCSVVAELYGAILLGPNSAIISSTVRLSAGNISIAGGAAVNTTGLAGEPPRESSGAGTGTHGDGAGHGGRGASCFVREGESQDATWGGDDYSWDSMAAPASYGSKGGSTSLEEDYGGGGGGILGLDVEYLLLVEGTIEADGGNGGPLGGGGSGGSIYIIGNKMKGSGRISASGGNGLAGGGGGRAAIDVYSRHDGPKVFVHGGSSHGCPENSGAAGTLYDAVPRGLIVSNHNKPTHTETLLLTFSNEPLWTNVIIKNHAKVLLPLLWGRVQIQGQFSLLCGAVLNFGCHDQHYSEFELIAEELLMSDSLIKVFGALRMSVKMLLMWNSTMLIGADGNKLVETSLLEASNLIVLRESSTIHSNANLGVHGQGLLNLSGQGDVIEAQRLILSLFYNIHVGPGSVLRGPLTNISGDMPMCTHQDCPSELIHPPADCNVNSSLSFTLQICRVEDIDVAGLIHGTVVHLHRAKSIIVHSSGTISSSGLGCKRGIGRGKVLSSGLGGGGGHGGKGGNGFYNGSFVEGGIAYGNADLPCELGSGSSDDNIVGSIAGGGIIVIGSLEHSLSSLTIHGSVEADGESSGEDDLYDATVASDSVGGLGGGSGGTILLFLSYLTIFEDSVLSSIGGLGSLYGGGGGGGGGRIHFHWSDILIGDEYLPVASVKGRINTRGGFGRNQSFAGESGTITGKDCPRGLYGTFCKECPLGTFKNATGSDRSLCYNCPSSELPHRAIYITIRGGVTGTPCPYKCTIDRYHMPHCYTAMEELIYTFGGPWPFGLLLSSLLVFLALVLSVARMKFVCTDELLGPAPTQNRSEIDHSLPFLESLNEVLETNRVEESQSHVHRMYFLGPNTFSEPWHLPHSPPEPVVEIVYEDAFNRFVDEINLQAAYQWWEGSIYSILCMIAYPLAWSWQQWRRRKKLLRLREFVRSEYDHACLRSCRSRALYEGLKVAATPDLLLSYVDFFLGGDEKRPDLPPRLQQRFPICLIFGGDGSYMAPFSLQSDNILTSLMSQSVPSTIWYRLVAGLNAHLRLVRRGHLKVTFLPVCSWIETHANPKLSLHRLRVDLAWFQATAFGYCQFGLVVSAVGKDSDSTTINGASTLNAEQSSRVYNIHKDGQPGMESREALLHRKISGQILDNFSLRMLEDKKDILYPFSLIVHNSQPIGHQDLVGLGISMLLLGDFNLVMLTLLQLYSISMVDIFLVLFVLPLGILSPFPAGINALFSHGPQRSAGLARVYALWNSTSLINVIVAFVCGFVHYKSSNQIHASLQTWSLSSDESGWWIFPTALVLCKCVQARLVDWHVANMEIQDHSLYSIDPQVFWHS